jgi:hypothetical protein
MSISYNDIVGIINNSYNYEGDSFELEYINYTSNNLFNSSYDMDVVNSNNFELKINSINTDTLIQGTSNRFIVDDTYNRDITFTNNLFSSNIITSNLSVIGDTTAFNTTLYQTEQLQIVNDTTATSMIVKQLSSNQNVAEFYNNINPSLVISSNGFIGINKISEIQERLDIDGNIKIKGNIYPETDITFDLGTSNKRFRDLYLSGNSINLDNLLISKDSSNNLDIKDNQGNYKNININEIELNNGNTKLTFQLDNDGNLIYKKNNISGTELLYPSVYTNLSDTTNSVSSNVMINYVGNTSNNLANYTSNTSLTNSNNLFNYSLTNSNNLSDFIKNTSNTSLTNSNNLSDFIKNTSNISLTNSNNLFNYSSNFTYNTAKSNINYNDLLNEPWINSGTNIYNNNLGNIGIGSQLPLYKLDIIGDIRATNLLGNGTNISNLNANNFSSGTLSTTRGGSKWGTYRGSNLTYNTNNGSILTASHLCGYGITSNVLPNLSQTNGFLMLRHNTFNGNLGNNFPFPECGTLYTNSSSGGDCPWGFYTGVVKHTALSIPINSLRFDIGQCAILNTLETRTGVNTFNPFLSMTYVGNVGIGSTFPNERLDVSGNINSTEYLIKNQNISNIFTTSNVFNNRLAIINTDTITQGSNNRFIVNDVYNRNITFTNNLISSNIITSNLSVIGDTTTFNTTIYQTEQLQVVNDTTATAMIVKQVNINKNVAEFYHQNNLLSLIINSNGNVGIGITNPLNKLDINGNINTTSISINNIDINTTITNNSNDAYLNSSNFTYNTSKTNINYNDLLNEPWINSGTNIYNFNSGNVGIGKSNPSTLLDVNGHINAVGNIYTQGVQPLNDGTSKAISIRSRLSGNVNLYSESGNIIFYTNSSNRFIISSIGNIGIGTDNPLRKLDIFNGDLLIRTSNESNNANILFGTQSNSSAPIKTAIIAESLNSWNRANLHFCLADDTSTQSNVSINFAKMTILNNGNIGIGSTNPLNKLDVNGNINTTSISINNIDINTTISNNSNNLANYTSNINNTLTNTISNTSNNLANYTSNINNSLTNTISNNSNNLANYTSNISLTNSNNLANYTSNTSNTLTNIISNNSNNLANYTSNTSNIFNNRLATLNINTDTIIQGSSNRFIVNDTYNRSVNFTGNFLSSSGTINSYDTINFYSSITPASLTWSTKGVSALGVAHSANQLSSNASAGDMILRSDSNNKLILQNGSNNASIIIANNFVGIGTTNPLYNLDINSNVNSREYFIKNLNISNIFVSSNVFDNRSNNLFNYTSNLSFTNSNLFNTRLTTLNINTDTITQGSSNRFIVNDIYNRDITFTGALISSNITTSNLSVIGETTTFNTTIYQTEQLQVVNDTTATAMIVKQVNINRNVAEFYHQNNQLSLLINSNGNIGIGTANSSNKLDVNGIINSTGLLINGTNIQTSISNSSNNLFTIINNSYCKKTTFYFTPYNPYTYNSITYYTYNIEISNFVRFIQLSPTIKLAKFRIHTAPVDSNFNGSEIRECEYLIMMSDLNGVLNVRAIGNPLDVYLQKIQAWKIVKSSSFTYLTYISPIQNINILCSIIDEA